MKIKSLLIGSAAASVVAVSGANAADPIVYAEPEPMEYVRICDVAGTGYFYIPGTETCLKVGGWIRHEIGASSSTDGFSNLTRARLEFSTWNQSDWGDVVGYVRLDSRLIDGQGRGRTFSGGTGFVDANGNGIQDPGEGDVVLNDDSVVGGNRDNRWDAQYSLGIGGLEMGFRDSQWNRFSGYGGLTDAGGSYGYQERHYISYTFASDAFRGIISLDHDNNSLDYMPDVMAGVGFGFGDVALTLSAGYDESTEDAAVKGTVNAPVGPATLRLVGLYSSGANAYWDDSEWSGIVGIGAPLTQDTAIAVDVQYWNDTRNASSAEWSVIGNLSHQIAPGLSALLEVRHDDFRRAADTQSGFLRFQRSF